MRWLISSAKIFISPAPAAAVAAAQGQVGGGGRRSINGACHAPTFTSHKESLQLRRNLTLALRQFGVRLH
ncbi:unnamed protein product [Prunus armeniaca]